MFDLCSIIDLCRQILCVFSVRANITWKKLLGVIMLHLNGCAPSIQRRVDHGDEMMRAENLNEVEPEAKRYSKNTKHSRGVHKQNVNITTE